jgi:hypothetical protein
VRKAVSSERDVLVYVAEVASCFLKMVQKKTLDGSFFFISRAMAFAFTTSTLARRG